MAASYRWLASRSHPLSLSHLPDGEWITVEEASRKFGVSGQLVRLRYLNNELSVIYFEKEKRLMVNVQDIKTLRKNKKNKKKRGKNRVFLIN